MFYSVLGHSRTCYVRESVSLCEQVCMRVYVCASDITIRQHEASAS